MVSEEAAISAQDVSFSYGDATILKNVTFDIPTGQYVGIIGPNGGGKTTLLRLIMGFLRPKQGSVRVMGKRPTSARGAIAYVPQRLPFDRLFPISALEVVLAGRLSQMPWYGTYSKADRDAAYAAMERVEMAHLAEQSFGSLSGGQSQRILIARALVSSPKILLLDEPTSSVDPDAQADIHSLLEELRGSMTILMVTHDLGTAIDRVERVLIVQTEVSALAPNQVCEHYTMGLYHTPLVPHEHEHPEAT